MATQATIHKNYVIPNAASCETPSTINGISSLDGKTKMFNWGELDSPSSYKGVVGGGVSRTFSPNEIITETQTCLTITNVECYTQIAVFKIMSYVAVTLPFGVNNQMNMEISYDNGTTWYLAQYILNSYNDQLPNNARYFQGSHPYFSIPISIAPSASATICARIVTAANSYHCNGTTNVSTAILYIDGLLLRG